MDANILKWKKEIKALKSNVKEAEDKKVELRRVIRQHLDEEALVGVHHFENVNNLYTGIEGLAYTISQVNHRLAAAKVQYEKLKASFPF